MNLKTVLTPKQSLNKAYLKEKVTRSNIELFKNNLIQLDYRLAWSRTYLKKYGLIENSTRGVWALTQSDIDLRKISSAEIVKHVRDQHKRSETRQAEPTEKSEIEIPEQTEDNIDWKQSLLNKLFSIDPLPLNV
jgi:restriction endonuclease Mrr